MTMTVQGMYVERMPVCRQRHLSMLIRQQSTVHPGVDVGLINCFYRVKQFIALTTVLDDNHMQV